MGCSLNNAMVGCLRYNDFWFPTIGVLGVLITTKITTRKTPNKGSYHSMAATVIMTKVLGLESRARQAAGISSSTRETNPTPNKQEKGGEMLLGPFPVAHHWVVSRMVPL